MSNEIFGQVVGELIKQIEIESNNYIKRNKKTKLSYRLTDARIQVKRVKIALNICVEKIQFALLLPFIIDDSVQFNEYFHTLNEHQFKTDWFAAFNKSVNLCIAKFSVFLFTLTINLYF